MSMAINTNVSALNALSNLEKTNAALSQSVERLSSGLRINRASDDPAGLIISENLQSQIAGQQQAVNNAQDASNLISTADGSLSQINALLRSIRTLAVHAANTGANDATAVQADQTQINSAIASIDRIATQTQYGSKKLLDGTAGVSANVTNADQAAGIYISGTFGGYQTQAGAVTLTVTQAATRASTALADSYASLGASVVNNAGTIVINGQTVSVGAGETVQAVLDAINSLTGVTHVSAGFSGSSVVLTQTDYGSGNQINYAETSDILNGGTASVASGTTAIATVTAMVYRDGAIQAFSTTFTGSMVSGGNGLLIGDNYGNDILLTEDGSSSNANTPTDIATINGDSMQFQVGANAGQFVSMSLGNVQTDQIGNTVVAGKSVRNIDVTTAQGADDAINMIDEAINQISSLRAQLGAFQTNTLQSTISYLGVSVQNLSASNSQIQDTDVASEVVNMTKNQILQQAGTSVLKTANSLPAQVLSLLQ